MTNSCLHCGLETTPHEPFCCKGCELAYKLIHNLNLGNYYKNRSLKSDQKPLKPEENNFADISEFITHKENNIHSLYLMVEGLHCAACIYLIENVLQKQQGTTRARINMSNKRLHLEWRGDSEYGNQLVKIIADLGYKLLPFDIEILKAEEKKYDSNLLKALSVAGFAAGNVMLISVALWSENSESMGIVTRNLLYLVSALIALPAIIYSGRIFFYSAFNAIKSGRTNMDVPISIAIILVSISSLFETFTFAEHVYFDSAIMLVFFLLIGRYLDFNIRKKALNVASDLMFISAGSAVIIENNKNKIIHTREIKKDMILLVTAGEKIAADGIIIQGNCEIDTSLITGESLPKKAKINDEVFAGTINLSGSIKIKVTKNKDESLLSQIVKLVENLEKNKDGYVRFADKISKYYTLIVHSLAAITFFLGYYLFSFSLKISFLNAVAVLIVTCPCALALAVPAVSIVATSRLMRKGILVKEGAALEKLNDVKAIIFDKTGTLTSGKMTLKNAFLFDGKNKSKIDNENFYFQMAASIASGSSHILSKNLVNNFHGKILNLEVKELAGHGLIATYQNQEIKLGKKEFATAENILIDDEKTAAIYMSYENKIAVFTFEDKVREDAAYVINQLKKLGQKIILLSGDQEKVVKNIAKKLEIDEYYFNKTPLEKCNSLKIFKNKYQNILMVGDGLNDAPSLVLADVSISPSSASDITKNAADIIFQGEKLSPVLDCVLIAKKSRLVIKQNFALSFLYNIITIPLAMTGHIIPLIAALAMSSSSIIVVLNSLRTARVKIMKM